MAVVSKLADRQIYCGHGISSSSKAMSGRHASNQIQIAARDTNNTHFGFFYCCNCFFGIPVLFPPDSLWLSILNWQLDRFNGGTASAASAL
eukprot:scaffold4719_cov15-Prasinocladus_malaysianus.AAC.1